jgi:phospholipase C
LVFAQGCGSDDAIDGSGNSGVVDHIETVFVIVMEKKGWGEVKANPSAPYLNDTLLPIASHAEAYKGPNSGNLHPSEPNYIWLEAGDNLGIVNDDDPDLNHQATTDHLVIYLEHAGVSWKSYQEDITGADCPLTSVGQYRPKHNPMVFFDDVTDTNDPQSQHCIDHMAPLGGLETDLANATAARYNFITPNQCNDMHTTCAPLNDQVAQGDAWLREWVPKILGSQQYKDGGALFITWDEAELFGGCLANCPIGMIVVSPLAKGGGYQNDLVYDHSSTLKSLQKIFDLTPLLRAAGDEATEDLRGLFKSFP